MIYIKFSFNHKERIQSADSVLTTNQNQQYV